jgi:hypothetical protein
MTKIAGSGSASASESESGSISQRHGSADPDPDPPQMSWIRNTPGDTTKMISYPNDDTALALQVEILFVTDDSVPAQLQHLQTYSSPHLSGQLLN